ncbi:hypothetical protein ACFPAF_04130 [Hymenobacter endophyticus]|uniref:WG repeat-containing protein n=1 Tax=Hymenobacter endophyticus TaxID=3076335 RepID=A0ABU3TDX2_9BACT|nr:hypothetical protein [Hymenobacter endophyticus]MDU0369572.1 hypothetical protein [Hymenobacter endophyticus]
MNTSEQVFAVPNLNGELINLYGKTGYGYIDLKNDTIIPTADGDEKFTKLAKIKGTIEILGQFLKTHVKGKRVVGGIVVKEFREDEVPAKYKSFLNKKQSYEDAVQEYLKLSPQTGLQITSGGQRVLHFGEYMPSIRQDEFDSYIVD